MTEEKCGAKLFIPGTDFKATLAVIHNSKSENILSNENFEKNGISLCYLRDKCLEIRIPNGIGAEPVLLQYWTRDKQSQFSTYETANMRIKRGSFFGDVSSTNSSSDSRLFVFELVNPNVASQEEPSVASQEEFHPAHTCYRFLVFVQEKSEEMKVAEKVQKLREEESKLHKMLTEVRDELESIRHQSQQEERSCCCCRPPLPQYNEMEPLLADTIRQQQQGRSRSSSSCSPVPQAYDEEGRDVQSSDVFNPPSLKRRKIEKQTTTKGKEEEEGEGELPDNFNLSDHMNGDPFSPSIFPGPRSPFSLSLSSNFNPRSSFLETSGSRDSSSCCCYSPPPPDSSFTPFDSNRFSDSDSSFPPTHHF